MKNHVNVSDTLFQSMICKGLHELAEAHQLSQECYASQSEFSIEIQRLCELELNQTKLRWLMKKKFVTHVIETSLVSSERREFHSDCGCVFTERSCFFLTDAGYEFYIGNRDQIVDSPNPQTVPPNNRCTPVESKHPVSTAKSTSFDKSDSTKPVWDPDRQELWFDGQLVKRYKLPSRNQIAVLNSFHEESWPVRIDDPLPPSPTGTPRRKLNDTVKGLNKNQKGRLLQFRSDGSGEGVIWEPYLETNADNQE